MQESTPQEDAPAEAIIVTTLDHRVVAWNPAAERLYVIPASEAVGKLIDELLTVDGLPWTRHESQRELMRRGTWQGTLRHATPAGTESTLSWSLSRVQLPDAAAEIIIAVAVSLETRVQAERMLHASERKTRSILRAAPIGIGMVVNRVLKEVNEGLCRMTGYSSDELLGNNARMLYPSAEDYEYVGREKYRQIAERGTGTVESRWRKKSGEIIDVLLSSTPLDPANLADGVTFTALDITERLRSLAELRESEAKFRSIIESSPLGMHQYVLEQDGRLVFEGANPSADRILGVDNSEFIGRTIEEAFPPLANTEVPERYRAVASGSGLWSTSQVNYRDGRIAGAYEVYAFQTSGLAGGLAHDFNNLLTGIIGNADLALMDLEPASPLVSLLNEVVKAARSAATLTQQLLAFSRQQMTEPRVVDLNDLVANLNNMLTRLIGEDIDLRIAAGKDLLSVKLDPAQFEQVVVNLAVNARDAMPRGGTLVLETENVELSEEYCRSHAGALPGPHVLLAVSDTGMGMGQEVLGHLFEPFFTTKPKGKGTGLGLATIYGTVKQAGGTIEVYSELGKGSTFKIYLPSIAEQAAKWSPERKSPDLPLGHEIVLLVEDEDTVRDLAKRVLCRLGYTVLCARNGAEALELAERHADRIDLLLTDVVMPGMSGRELASRLSLAHPETKVLYASGYTENIIVHHGVIDEGVCFIGKPYSTGGLARKVREVLDATAQAGPLWN
ncbi:MAG: PAS domain S-box protein [Polyangiaceae bacterium]|nr:PAS domain S-box protein [Polyangiaceae bacterium]